MKSDYIFRVIATLSSAVMIAIFIWAWNLNSRIAIMEKEHDSISKHWKIMNAHRTQINILRTQHDLGIFEWPSLD